MFHLLNQLLLHTRLHVIAYDVYYQSWGAYAILIKVSNRHAMKTCDSVFLQPGLESVILAL